MPEDAGVGLTEAVDALLQIAHEEQIIPAGGGKAGIKGVLQGVRVLILVHHHGGVILPDALAQRGGLAVRVPQQAESLMLKITELQQLPLLLFGGEAGIKIPHRRKQGPEPGQGFFPVRLGLFHAAGDKAADGLKQVRRLTGAGLDGGLVVAFQPPAGAFQARRLLHAQDRGGEPIVKGRPLPGPAQPLHLAQPGGGFFQPAADFLVFFLHRLFGFPDGCRRLFQLCFPQLLHRVRVCIRQRRFKQLPGRLRVAGSLPQQDVVPAGGSKPVLRFPRG